MSSVTHPSLHERVERVTEAGDLRLLYGLGVPFLLVVACVAALAISGATWLVAPLIVVVLAMTGIIVVGFNQMLDDPGDDEPR